MKIGIIGAGNVGTALAGSFRKLQHTAQIANSRGPDTLSKVAEGTGATPVPLAKVAEGVDLLVIAIPENSITALPEDLLRELPAGTPIVDAGNYIPLRDGVIGEIEAGMTESEWVARVLGRPVVKAFNNIITYSLTHSGLPKGSENRIALPVAGDSQESKQFVLALVEEMGFDGVDAGPLSNSWRQQPGTPVYATDYDAATLKTELASADRSLAPRMRDATMQKLLSLPPNTTPQEIVRLARSLWKVSHAD